MRAPAVQAAHHRVHEILDHIRLDPTLRGASVGSQRIEAANVRELRAKLINAIYAELHAGAAPPDGSALRPRSLRDEGLEAGLTAVVPHATSPAEGVVLAILGDGLAVRLSGVSVRLPAHTVRDGAVPEPGAELTFDLPAVRLALSPGFLMVDGPHGHEDRGGAIGRVFVHVTGPEHAPEVWGRVVRALNELGIGYRAKVLSDPRAYPRRDAVVVYHGAADAGVPAAVADAVAGAAGVGDQCSLFTSRLAAGVSAADDPADTRVGMRGLSFGQHRATVVTSALLQHATEGGSVDEVVVTYLLEAGIDPAEPAFNLTGTAAGRRPHSTDPRGER
ncbi:T3SS effector HopA1 family protein [Amycolatopsis suaedae]|uniref:Uncharacterized protein n=1 Tax=Amycolatopsis suaedae TaxID=2510978 RepID=A0A4Q7J9Z2_9PSEU|nr:T3SS effector HopA1 family protein [Amycolatopsis suaedae]RZQ62984.1 hypothetical protein EWH70_14910 [Amycolatopsis suaedae]